MSAVAPVLVKALGMRGGRFPTCVCLRCAKCKKREYMRKWSAKRYTRVVEVDKTDAELDAKALQWLICKGFREQKERKG